MTTRKTLLNLERPASSIKSPQKSSSKTPPKKKKNSVSPDGKSSLKSQKFTLFNFKNSKNKKKEEDEIIEELSEETLKKYKDLISNKNKSSLSFGNSKFHLKSLDKILKFPKLKPDKIFDVDVSNNLLKEIEILNNFVNLKTLNAGNNQIEEIELKLNLLEFLNLEKNRLKKIPNIQDFPRLKWINLSNNVIEKIEIEFLSAKKRINYIDLSNNKIDFKNGADLKKWIEYMKTMDVLQNFNVEYNPFLLKYFRLNEVLIRELGYKIETINGIRCQKEIEDIKNDTSLAPLENLYSQEMKKEDGTELNQNQSLIKKQITLEELNELIESCSSNPIKCMKHITKLAQYVQIIINEKTLWEKIFLSKDAQTQLELNDQMDNFLQNSLILIENQQNIQRTLINLIANLSVIPHASFGDKCLRTLNDLMSSGDLMKDLVTKVLENLIEKWLHPNITLVPRPVLNGLVLITNEKEIVSIYSKDSIKYMIEWIQQILKFTKNDTIMDREILELHDNALELVAAASGSKKTAEYMRSFNIGAQLCLLFKLSKEPYFSMRYISLLQIIERTSRADKETSEAYRDTKNSKDSLFKDIQLEIMSYIQEFKKNKNDLRDEQAKDTDTIVKIKFNKFSTLINAYSSILLYQKFDLTELKSDPIIKELMLIITLNKVNPVLLTAICNFIFDLLNNESISQSQNEEQTKFISEEIQKLNPLLPYMGGKKYASLCEMGEMYQANTFNGKEPVARIHLANKVLHNLFIAIIKLITYYTEKANGDSSGKTIWTQISKSLNQNRREAYLFNCLDIPSDEVKLKVVRCLLVIKNEEWETDEVGHLVTMLGSYKNLGAGNTEEVLASIFIILSKMANDKHSKIGKEFASLFSENAITNCFDILARNMERNVRESQEENTQKFDLAISCVYFLKVVSNIPGLRGILRGSQVLNSMRRSLLAEQKYSDESLIPVEIECTWSGHFLENLLLCTAGNDAIPPYNMVSYRIIARVADVLQGKMKENILDLGVCYNKEDLRKKTQEEFMRKLKKEFFIWEDDVDEEKIREMIKNMHDTEKENFDKQHNFFSNQNGWERILVFLLGKTASTQAAILEKQLLKEFDKKYSNNTIQQEIEEKSKDFVEEEEKMLNEEEKNKKGGKLFDKATVKKRGKELIEKAFQELQLSTNDIDERTMDKFILTPPVTLSQAQPTKKKNSPKSMKMRIFDIELIANSEDTDHQAKVKLNKRALLISAMLRCMHAAIEYAPEESYRQNSISQIKQKKIIKMLTQLCASTGWVLGNVGSKYLKIIYYGIKLPHKEFNESKENFEIYDLVSKAIYDMLQIVRKKLFQEDKIPLTQEDKMLIFDLAKTTSVLISQVPNIFWVTSKTQIIVKHGSLYKTPQEKCVELSLLKLFPRNILKTFIDVMLTEMKVSSDLSGEVVKDKKAIYIRLSIRLHILTILGTYISKCKDKKFEILEQFSRAQIFEKKYIRQSFVQEILFEMTKSNYQTKLEIYLNENELFYSQKQERILFLDFCFLRNENSSTWTKRTVVFTNKGVYFLIAPKNPCSLCPAENFCPVGPALDFRLLYENIKFVLNLEGKQRMAIQTVKQMGSGLLSEGSKCFVMFFPKLNSKASIMQILAKFETIQRNINQDELTARALDKLILKDSICFWGVYNPTVKKIHNETNISAFDFDEYRLFIISEEKLYILKEMSSEWFFFFQAEGITKTKEDEDNEEDEEDEEDERVAQKKKRKKEEKLNEMQKKMEIKKERAQQIQNKLFTLVETYDLNTIVNISFDQGPIPLISLKFSKTIDILFGCDFARENMRIALLSIINSESGWKKKTERAGPKTQK